MKPEPDDLYRHLAPSLLYSRGSHQERRLAHGSGQQFNSNDQQSSKDQGHVAEHVAEEFRSLDKQHIAIRQFSTEFKEIRRQRVGRLLAMQGIELHWIELHRIEVQSPILRQRYFD